MKIALVYDYVFPYSIGGAESRNFSLAKNLVLKGHEVHIYGVKMWPGKNNLKVTNNFYIHGISKYSNKYNRKTLEPLKYSFLLYFELIKQDFDIIEVTAFPYLPFFSCKLYSLIKRKPLITIWHEVWDDYWRNFGFIGFFGYLIEKCVAKLSSNNICVSELIGKQLKKAGAKNIKIINNWIDLEEIKRAKPLKQKYDIISIGRHLKHKNFGLLLKVCSVLVKDYPKIKVLIIGEGPETLTLLKIRKTLNLEKNVEILGFTKTREQMYRYLKSSKIFVLLSELEGFSIVAFEAMAAGLPVVTIKAKNNYLSEYLNEKNVCKDKIQVIHRVKQLLKSRREQINVVKYSEEIMIPEIENYQNEVINNYSKSQ